MMLDDIALFVHIVKTGSLRKAAELQALPAATVTRRLQKLEHQLKCKLITRSARQFNLTPEGKKLFEECSYLVESLEDRTNLFETSINEMSGKIKILAPTNLAIGPLAAAWSTFMSIYEDIELEFVLGFKTEEFLATQADFAIRIGPQKNSDLSQVRIGTSKTILVSSQKYIDSSGLPRTLDDLYSHRFVLAVSLHNWPLHNKQDNTSFNFCPPNPRAVANDLRLIRQLTIDGLGISLLPMHEVASELDSNKLVQILPAWTGQDRNLYIIWDNGRPLSRRAQLLIEHLKTYTANWTSQTLQDTE